MSRRNKRIKSLLKHHFSLNQEFAEANEAIMTELKAELVCNRCGALFFAGDHAKEGWFCQEEDKFGNPCNGTLKPITPKVKVPATKSLRCDVCQCIYTQGSTESVYKEYQLCLSPTCNGRLKLITIPPEVLGLGKLSTGTGQGQFHYNNDTSYSYKSCDHPGDKIVFEKDGKKLYASNTHCLKEYSGKWNLIIDLAGVVNPPKKNEDFVGWQSPKKYDVLKQYTVADKKELPSEWLRLQWADMQAPPVTLDFWLKLWEMLPEKTVIACFGGHGRTGTCLAAFMIATGMDYYTAIDTVHVEHCTKAIESLSQEEYLHKLYLEMLSRQMAVAKQANNEPEMFDIAEDIKYALANKPSRFQKNDKKSDKKDSVVLDMTTGNVITDSDNIKTIAGEVHIKECRNAGCTIKDCVIEAHQQWVPWYDSFEWAI